MKMSRVVVMRGKNSRGKLNYGNNDGRASD